MGAGRLRKVLIANRGEIARRVIRTSRRLGIRSVAVYSDADRHAAHVVDADEAVRIGPEEAVKSYLNVDAVLEAASRTGADAIHPGYGFLSENANFADACMESGLIFVGPPAKAIREMGSKSAARRLMSEAGVPIIPGYHGEDQHDKSLLDEAKKIGFPVLIKPVLGGGGKGMRIVHDVEQFQEMLDSSRAESRSSFDDDSVLLEKYISRSRHVEVQVFADKHGNCVHLWERDCSVQRRHQKIIEEAPAPGISEELRHELGTAAVAAARKVDYENAGTVEFILDMSHKNKLSYYFLEMNTRLQVEHPVTELITGQDLVEWQLRVAQGDALPLTKQDQIPLLRHSMEARIYAESPKDGFLPQAGCLHRFRFRHKDEEYLRVDQGVREGDHVGVFYDPMIAKVIAWGETREDARLRLMDSLDSSQVLGIETNAKFAASILRSPLFVSAHHDTSLLEANMDDLIASSITEIRPQDTALAAVAHTIVEVRAAQRLSPPGSAFAELTGFALHEPGTAVVQLDDLVLTVTEAKPNSYTVTQNGNLIGTVVVHRVFEVKEDDLQLEVTVDDVRFPVTCVHSETQIAIYTIGGCQAIYNLPIAEDDIEIHDEEQDAAERSVKAPLSGRVKSLNVEEGQRVRKGDILVNLEAMKMVHGLQAPRDGIVTKVHAVNGDVVEHGDVLVRVHIE